ncbi:unnamed protein product [Urochloa humidicola]
MALRRLTPLLGAFEYIDAVIEAADAAPGSRDAFRSGRERILEMVCDAAEDDEGGGDKAEALCGLLDDAMAGSLATLREVPAEKIPLEKAGDLVAAVGALMREHPSERVRGLAGNVARGWKACVTAEVDKARARAAVVLDGILAPPPPPPSRDGVAPAAGSDTKLKKKAPEEQPRPSKTAVVNSDPIVSRSHEKPSVNLGAPKHVPPHLKKTPSVIVSSVTEEEKKMEATKRKLQERYQEAEDAKRRRTIQVIKPPRPPPVTTGQRQRNAHPGVRARAPVSCAAEKRFVKSSSLRMMI